MSDLEPNHGKSVRINASEWELGGLRFYVFFTVGHGIGRGATGKVFGRLDGTWTELLRFDNFVDESGPHFHCPADAPQTDFDRSLGDPVAWYASQIRDHLVEWLGQAGFAEVVPGLDKTLLEENARRFETAMRGCVPDEAQLEFALATWRTQAAS